MPLRPGERSSRARRGGPNTVTFDPDPQRLVAPLTRPPVVEIGIAPGIGVTMWPPQAAPVAAKPSHAFRVLRPADLVVLDVLAFGLDLVMDGGAALVPTEAQARLEVRFPFQHLGERAFFKAGPPTAPEPDVGDEPRDPPPIQVLAAHGSRLVFGVPLGERIAYSIEGVLAAISRLPLLVAPAATARAISTGSGGLRGMIDVVSLPGGLRLGRMLDGQLALAPVRAARSSQLPSGAAEVTARALAIRTARTLLAGEAAVDVSGVDLQRTVIDADATPALASDVALAPHSIGDLIARPVGPIRRIRQRPRAPRANETAIEAPFRLIISPSTQGGFAHGTAPQSAPADATRIELWHSRLGVRQIDGEDGEVRIVESRHPQRVIRAIWARDKVGLGPDVDAPAGESPFRMSLNPRRRVILVRQSADTTVAAPEPVDATRMYLSSLGSYLDLQGRWDPIPYASAGFASIEAWDHEAPMGRDQYVRVVEPKYFFPLGIRCALVTITERRILDATNPQAQLIQRKFIEVGQPTRTYDDRRMPFKQITIRPSVSPDIRDPLLAGTPDAPGGEDLFWPVVGNAKFRWTLDCLDWEGRRIRLQAPLLVVDAALPRNQPGRRVADIKTTYETDPERPVPASGQSIAFAQPTKPGDTSLETRTLRFVGEPGARGSITSTPALQDADVVVPAMRHLAPTAPETTVSYAAPYLAGGFTGNNAEAQVFLALKTPATISFAQGTDRAGGFVQPDLPVRGLSKVLGAVGDIDDLVNRPAAQKFNPAKFLDGVLPKLFGLFELTDILAVVGLDGAPAFVTEELDRVAALLSDLHALGGAVERSADRLLDDAAGAATTALQTQAQQGQARLAALGAQLVPRIDELTDAIDSLLALDAPSTLPAVTAAVSGALNALGGTVRALGDVIREQPLPPPVKAELERLVNALSPVLEVAEITSAIDSIAQFVNGIDPAGLSVRARYEWRPRLTNFPNVADDDALFLVRPDGFLLSIEARASGSDGVGTDVLAELRGFALNLFPTAPLMRLAFDRLAFRAASGRKPEVDVVFRGIEFVGVLSFIETLKELVPFDGFSDPPYLDVSPAGVRAGFDVALPAVAVGVFSLENIGLGADARVPFIGNEALTIGFYFCTREKPFRLTVMMIGGGGFVGIRLSPKGMVLLEMALEAGACLSVNLGVASGSVSVMIGIYLRLEADAGSLTGYFRIRGEVDVLGLISASITLELSLTYEFETGKMVGRASITIEVEVFLLSFSVSVSCERRLAGSNGDPTFEQFIGVAADGSSPAWNQYCNAFAGS